MVEINPVVLEEERFLGIRIFLPKCTIRLLFNMKLVIVDQNFHVSALEKKCLVPVVSCTFCELEKLTEQRCMDCSIHAMQLGMTSSMSVKDAIRCAFSK